MKFRLAGAVSIGLLAATGCGSSSSSMPAASAGIARVRFADGAPQLEALIGGTPQTICSGVSAPCYLQVNGQTVTNLFTYGSLTPFLPVSPGTQRLTALDALGYRVGPASSMPLAAGKDYTLVLVGAYPQYRVLTFEEPAHAKSGARLSLYEASPSVPKADFGSFNASSSSNFKKLGSAVLGSVTTVALGARVSNFGGYAGKGTKPFSGGTVIPSNIDSFDKRNALPFNDASRLSLFLLDVKSGSSSVFGSLDR